MEILGIDYNVPVSLGGHDHICGSYAAIAYRENVMLDSMGTAESILAIINPDQIHMGAIYKKGIGTGLYILPNKVYIYKAFDYSGALINYVMRLFLNKREKNFKEKDFINFFNEAKIFTNKEIPIKIYITHNKNRLFNILNITPNSQRGEIFLATLHYIFEKSKEIIDLLEQIVGNKSKIIVIGGNTKNKFVIHEKAKILNRPLFITRTGEAVALGAALLGGIGAGVFVNYEDAVKNLNREEEKINP
jgi:xylulokinase